MATRGQVTPELTGKLPGCLSISTGLEFADVPNGLDAIPEVMADGWALIIPYAAFCELPQDESLGTAAAAGDIGRQVRTSGDPAEEQK